MADPAAPFGFSPFTREVDLTPKPAEARAYDPSWRERLAQAMMGDSQSQGRRDVVTGMLGTGGLGSAGMGLVDMTPAGIPLGVQEGMRSGNLQEAALAATPFGIGARGGAKMAQGIRAYHGSPHDFDRFDVSKIGTGEGAQAYGHGLYFAEKEPVALSYRNKLADTQAPSFYTWQGREIPGRSGPEAHAVSLSYHDSPATARRIAKEGLKAAKAGDPWAVEMGGVPYWEAMQSVADQIRSRRDVKFAQGRMYEVDINAQPEQFLNFDAPFSKQTAENFAPLVQDALRSRGYLGRNESGPRQLETALRSWKMEKGGMSEGPMESLLGGRGNLLGGSPEEVTKNLLEAGIPGTRYFDEGSRNSRRGSRNYVVFDPGIVQIMRKYAIPGTIGTSAAFGSLAPGDQQ